MRINTLVVWDIESGAILQRESYEYFGSLVLCANVTAPIALTTEGAYWVEVRTATTPGVGGIDHQGGGHGAVLRELGGGVLPFIHPPTGSCGTQRLTAGTDILTYAFPASWEDVYSCFMSGTPNEPPVATGWGILLAQHRNRLVRV